MPQSVLPNRTRGAYNPSPLKTTTTSAAAPPPTSKSTSTSKSKSKSTSKSASTTTATTTTTTTTTTTAITATRRHLSRKLRCVLGKRRPHPVHLLHHRLQNSPLSPAPGRGSQSVSQRVGCHGSGPPIVLAPHRSQVPHHHCHHHCHL